MKLNKVFILNPSQSRRLIAKGVVNLPQIQYALEKGKIFVGRGSSNAFVLEELYQKIGEIEKFNKGDFVAGQIVPGKRFMQWWLNKGNRKDEVLFYQNQAINVKDRVKEIEKFAENDIVIKGGNALDINGIPGVLAGGKGGGTIGSLEGNIQAKGIEVVCPIGLEKLVFGNLLNYHHLMGINNMEHPAEGIPCGLIPMPYATVITEIEALEFLFDCDVYHVASGGVGGAEGSVSLLINCYDEEEMKKIITFMEQIAEEPIYKPNLDKKKT